MGDELHTPDSNLNPEEKGSLEKELEGENKLDNAMESLTAKGKSFSEQFTRDNPGKKYLYARIGDRKTESGFREVELRIENDNSFYLNVHAVDVNTEGDDFSKSILFTFDKESESEKGFTRITFRREIGSPERTVIAYRDETGAQSLKRDTTGSKIKATQIVEAAEEIEGLLERFQTDAPEAFDEYRTENTSPQLLTIGGGENRHPEARWN